MSEPTEDYCRRIGSQTALESRLSLRAGHKLNKPIRCLGGLASIVARLCGNPTTVGHRWECECNLCRPWLWRGDDKVCSDKGQPARLAIPPPIQRIEPTKPMKQPRRKWSEQRGRSSN